jgi:hypothetical protein
VDASHDGHAKQNVVHEPRSVALLIFRDYFGTYPSSVSPPLGKTGEQEREGELVVNKIPRQSKPRRGEGVQNASEWEGDINRPNKIILILGGASFAITNSWSRHPRVPRRLYHARLCTWYFVFVIINLNFIYGFPMVDTKLGKQIL